MSKIKISDDVILTLHKLIKIALSFTSKYFNETNNNVIWSLRRVCMNWSYEISVAVRIGIFWV